MSITANAIWFISTNVWNKFTTDPRPVLDIGLKEEKYFRLILLSNLPLFPSAHPSGCSLNSLKRVMRWKTNVIRDHRTEESNKFHRALFSTHSRGTIMHLSLEFLLNFLFDGKPLRKSIRVIERSFTRSKYWKVKVVIL